VRSLTPVSPRAVTTPALASAKDCPPSIKAATKVVKGLMTVLPAGAASTPAKALFVSVSVPPLASKGCVACCAVKVRLAKPVLSVEPTSGSSSEITPSPFKSTKTLASLTGPSTTRSLVTVSGRGLPGTGSGSLGAGALTWVELLLDPPPSKARGKSHAQEIGAEDEECASTGP